MTRILKLIPIALFLLLAASTVISEWKPDLTLQELISGPVFWKMAVLLILLAMVYWGWGFLRKVEASQKYRRADDVLKEARRIAEREKEAALELQKRVEKECSRKMAEKEAELKREKARLKEYVKKIERQNLELKATVGRLMKLVKQKSPADGSPEA